MNKVVFSLLLMAFFFTACDNHGEKNAQQYLDAAQLEMESGHYNQAKLLVDSLKMIYPKAFEARKKSIALMQQIELGEQQVSVSFIDSVLMAKELTMATQRKRFVLQKDKKYQDIGNYFYATQVIDKNKTRSYLRAQTDELGYMCLTSIFVGRGSLRHSAVKAMVADGSYAQTPKSTDQYTSKNLGVTTEKCDYPLQQDGGLTAFINLNKDKKITLYFQGKRTKKIALTRLDKKAISEIYQFSLLLSSIQSLTKERASAQRKIAFIQCKMKESK